MNAKVTQTVMAAPAVIPPDYVPPYQGPEAPVAAPQQEEKTLPVLGLPLNKETALMGAEMGSMMLGPVGMAASGGISFLSANEHARNEMIRMTDQYREQIAQITGVPTHMVTPQHLELAAAEDERFGKLLESITKEKESRPAESIAALPGFMAGAAAGTAVLPVGGTIIGGTLGAMGAGSAVGKMTGNDPEQTIDYAIQSVCDRLANGEVVSTADVFNVRLLQEGHACETIHNDYGKPFSKLEPAQQLDIMQSPEYQMLSNTCYLDAQAINGGANPMQLMLGRVAPDQGQFTQAVMAGRTGGQQPKNFREAVVNKITDPNLAV